MTHESETMPPALAARLAAVAAEQHRNLRDVLRDAVEMYLSELRPPTSTRSPAEAVARIRASRSGNTLPDGITTIRDLLTFGRA
jgi:hypothetical protein